MRFVTKDYDYKFFKVEERNDKIYGYRFDGGDTTSIVIPKANIKAINLDSRGGTIGVILSPFVIAFIVVLAKDCWYC